MKVATVLDLTMRMTMKKIATIILTLEMMVKIVTMKRMAIMVTVVKLRQNRKIGRRMSAADGQYVLMWQRTPKTPQEESQPQVVLRPQLKHQ
jgi:hypothetical protein